jgi:hypothetical protein
MAEKRKGSGLFLNGLFKHRAKGCRSIDASQSCRKKLNSDLESAPATTTETSPSTILNVLPKEMPAAPSATTPIPPSPSSEAEPQTFTALPFQSPLTGKFDLYSTTLSLLRCEYLPEGATAPDFRAVFNTILFFQKKPEFTLQCALRPDPTTPESSKSVGRLKFSAIKSPFTREVLESIHIIQGETKNDVSFDTSESGHPSTVGKGIGYEAQLAIDANAHECILGEITSGTGTIKMRKVWEEAPGGRELFEGYWTFTLVYGPMMRRFGSGADKSFGSPFWALRALKRQGEEMGIDAGAGNYNPSLPPFKLGLPASVLGSSGLYGSSTGDFMNHLGRASMCGHVKDSDLPGGDFLNPPFGKLADGEKAPGGRDLGALQEMLANMYGRFKDSDLPGGDFLNPPFGKLADGEKAPGGRNLGGLPEKIPNMYGHVKDSDLPGGDLPDGDFLNPPFGKLADGEKAPGGRNLGALQEMLANMYGRLKDSDLPGGDFLNPPFGKLVDGEKAPGGRNPGALQEKLANMLAEERLLMEDMKKTEDEFRKEMAELSQMPELKNFPGGILGRFGCMKDLGTSPPGMEKFAADDLLKRYAGDVLLDEDAFLPKFPKMDMSALEALIATGGRRNPMPEKHVQDG